MSTPTLVGAPAVLYAGLATRAVGLAVDVAIAQVIVFAGGAVLALVASLVGGDLHFETLGRILAALAWAGRGRLLLRAVLVDRRADAGHAPDGAARPGRLRRPPGRGPARSCG